MSNSANTEENISFRADNPNTKTVRTLVDAVHFKIGTLEG